MEVLPSSCRVLVERESPLISHGGVKMILSPPAGRAALSRTEELEVMSWAMTSSKDPATRWTS